MSGVIVSYEKGRLAFGHAVGAAFWSLFWLLNGHFTVQAWVMICRVLGYDAFALAWYGWVFHLAISLIQGMMWKAGSKARLTFITVGMVGVIDIGSTAIGLQGELLRLGFQPPSIEMMIGVVFGAILIALIPEKMIIAHFRGMGIIR